MDTTLIRKHFEDIEKIQIILNTLKQQVNQYNFKQDSTKSNTEVMQSKRAQRLTVKARNLLEQHRKIKAEINYYEKIFEKALSKSVKHVKLQIKEDQLKLNTLKQRYNELNTKAGIEESIAEKKPRLHVETPNSQRSNEVRRPRPKFKPRILLKPRSNKMKIKINRNKKLNKREILFVNDSNVQQSITRLVKNVTPSKTLNTRECKIMLQKLTEEQMRRYIGSERIDVTRTKQLQATRKSSQLANIKKLTKEPNWHIKIPKSVLEESQEQGRNRPLSKTSAVENTTSTN